MKFGQIRFDLDLEIDDHCLDRVADKVYTLVRLHVFPLVPNRVSCPIRSAIDKQVSSTTQNLVSGRIFWRELSLVLSVVRNQAYEETIRRKT